MATLAGPRAQFTWALNQYNLSEDSDTRAKFARRMAKYIAAVPNNGLTVSEVTHGQSDPSEVDQLVDDPGETDDPGITEEQAVIMVEEIIDTSDVIKLGEGTGVVYGYGCHCCQDRIKIDLTDSDTVGRIAQQIYIDTPDRPVLLIEIRTNKCRSLERAIETTLEIRGSKITGGGAEMV